MRKIPIYSHPAAGWPALVASTRKLMDYKAFLRGSISILRQHISTDVFIGNIRGDQAIFRRVLLYRLGP